jgi:hypothetical protein
MVMYTILLMQLHYMYHVTICNVARVDQVFLAAFKEYSCLEKNIDFCELSFTCSVDSNQKVLEMTEKVTFHLPASVQNTHQLPEDLQLLDKKPRERR